MTRASREPLPDHALMQALRHPLVEALLELARDGVWIHRAGVIEMSNRAGAALVGSDDPAALVGRHVCDFLIPEHRPRAEARLALIETTRLPLPVHEYLLRAEDGSTVEVEVSGFAVPTDDGVHVAALLRPVSERKRVERELAEARRELRGVFDALAEGVIVRDTLGQIIECNAAAERIFGFRPGEPGSPLWPAVNDDGQPLPVPDHPSALTLRTGLPTRDVELSILRQDGRQAWISVNAEPLRDEHGHLKGVVTSFADITERRLAEQALAARETSYAMLVQQASDGIFVADGQGRYSEVNDAACRMLGYTREELLALRIEDLIAPDDLAAQPVDYEALRSGRPLIRERHLLRKDGSVLEVEISGRMLPGGEFLGLARDVTARKTAEEALRAKDVAERANRAKSEFVSRLSHELRTPLNAVIGFSDLLLLSDEVFRAHEAARGQVRHIRKAGEHLLLLINDLLDLSRIESGSLAIRLQVLDLAQAVDEALHDLRPQAALRHVRLEVRAPQGPRAVVWADATRLRQIVVNLASNAVKYNRAGGTVTVRIEQQGPWGLLAVRDTGEGMSEAQLQQLFTPFNRLGREHGPVEGTGLGLAIARSLAQLMHGELCAHSVPGEGSTFELRLPLAAS